MHSGHEAGAGRSAYGSAAVKLGEPHTRGGQLIDIGGSCFLLSITTHIAIAQVVGNDQYDIGLAAGSRLFCAIPACASNKVLKSAGTMYFMCRF